MNATRRLVFVLTALLLPSALLVQRVSSGGGVDTQVQLRRLPNVLGDYQLQKVETFEEEVLKIIEPEQYIMRLYGKEGGDGVWIYAGYYSGRLQTGAHEPTVCYPAFGWEIVSSKMIEVPMLDGGTLNARLLEADLDGRRELVLYWFQPVNRWPAPNWVEEVARIWDAMRGTPQYVFVRQSIALPASGDGRRTLEQFARILGPEMRELMSPLLPE